MPGSTATSEAVDSGHSVQGQARPRNELYTPEQIVAAIREARGLVYHAAKQLGCSATTVRRYVNTYEQVAEALEESRGRIVDDAEGKLADAIGRGEAWAVTLALKTLGRDRGYVERQEHDHRSGGPKESLQELRDRARRLGIPPVPTSDLEDAT